MKRTTTRRQREMKHFLTDNRRLFPFIALFLAGVGIGVAICLTTFRALPTDLLALSPVESGGAGWFHALGEAFFSTAVLLGVLYLLGLWACGTPFILLIPLLHGIGLGLTEAYYYRTGPSGVGVVASLVMPVGLLNAAVLIAACAESVRLSSCLSRRLLPGGEQQELWSSFRLYSLRFLLFVAVSIVVAVIEVLLRQIVL